MCEIPKKIDEIEVFPSNNASLKKKYTLKVINKYYDISETLYQLLELIDNKRSIVELTNLFSQKTGKTLNKSDLTIIIDKHFVKKNIVYFDEKPTNEEKNESYLLVKIPLLSSKIIEPLALVLKVFFQKYILFVLLTGAILFHVYLYIFYDNAPSFSLTNLKATEASVIFIILFITTLFHELGHSSACKYIGAKIGSIGVGLYLYMPVFYSDVTDVWIFKRSKRLLVDFGGIYFQLILIPFIFLIFLHSNNHIFLFTIYFLDFSIISSMNPILRFDGYWIATDISGIPNLRKRSKELFYYYIKSLFNLDITAPDFHKDIPKSSRYFLIVYSLVSNIIFSIYIYIIITYLPTLFSNIILLTNELILFLKNNSPFDNYTDLFSTKSYASFFFVYIYVVDYGFPYC